MTSQLSSKASYSQSFWQIVVREAFSLKSWLALLFALICLAVLGVGTFYPERFTTWIVIEQPPGAKPVGEPKTLDQVQEDITSPELLSKFLSTASPVNVENSDAEVEIQTIASAIQVEQADKPNRFKIGYGDPDPKDSYRNLNELVNLFIKESSLEQVKQSREAYQFVNNQAENQKLSLLELSEALDLFKQVDVDTDEESLRSRLSESEAEVKNIRLEMDEAQNRITSLKLQISQKAALSNGSNQVVTVQNQLAEAQIELEFLRQSYTDDYPDVVNLKQRMETLRQELLNLQDPDYDPFANSVSGRDPVYEQLRKRLASEELEMKESIDRLESLEQRIEDDHKRLSYFDGESFDLNELSKIYESEKMAYEQLLQEKDKAREAMDLASKGGARPFEIVGKAHYPTKPESPRFSQFFVAGPLIAAVVPIILLFAYVQIDPRIRSAKRLERTASVPVLGVIPVMNTPLHSRILRSDMILLGVFMAIVVIAYLAIAYTYQEGLF